MSKRKETWWSERAGGEITLARWGEIGAPVLVFATAGGDAEEIERFLMVDACADLLARGVVKLYSVDSLAGRAWFTGRNDTTAGARVQLGFDACIFHEVLPAIRADCNDPDIEILTAGASVGAYNALNFLCRHPDVTRSAICLSGTYGLERFLEGPMTPEFFEVSPLHFVPAMAEDDERLARLRSRFTLLAHGEGRYEDPAQSWRVADVLGARGVPNRVDSWGPEWDHDWVTWRAMLPRYLEEFLGSG